MDTKNFNPETDNLACKCCGEGETPLILLVILEHARDYFNSRPVTVTNASRCWSHNHNVGGTENSQHLIRELNEIDHTYSLAVDIQIKGIHPRTVYEYFDTLPYSKYLGIGYYEPTENHDGFVHVDVRGDWLGNGKLNARWEG